MANEREQRGAVGIDTDIHTLSESHISCDMYVVHQADIHPEGRKEGIQYMHTDFIPFPFLESKQILCIVSFNRTVHISKSKSKSCPLIPSHTHTQQVQLAAHKYRFQTREKKINETISLQE